MRENWNNGKESFITLLCVQSAMLSSPLKCRCGWESGVQRQLRQCLITSPCLTLKSVNLCSRNRFFEIYLYNHTLVWLRCIAKGLTRFLERSSAFSHSLLTAIITITMRADRMTLGRSKPTKRRAARRSTVGRAFPVKPLTAPWRMVVSKKPHFGSDYDKLRIQLVVVDREGG